MDRGEMLDRMSASELAQWEYLECIEPFGERAAWIRHAALCTLLVNINTPADQPRADFDKFLPQTLQVRTSESSKPMDPANVRAVMQMIADHQNAIVARQKEVNGANR